MEDEVISNENVIEVKNVENTEKMSDVIHIQLMLCILIVLIFLVMNIFYPEVCHAFSEKFKSVSGRDTEEIVVNAVNKIVEYTNGVMG